MNVVNNTNDTNSRKEGPFPPTPTRLPSEKRQHVRNANNIPSQQKKENNTYDNLISSYNSYAGKVRHSSGFTSSFTRKRSEKQEDYDVVYLVGFEAVSFLESRSSSSSTSNEPVGIQRIVGESREVGES